MDYTNYNLNFEAPLVEIMSAAIAQGTIDIPNTMPVVEEILYSHARVADVNSSCTDGTLTIEATVNFIVVYCDRDGKKHSLEAKTSFNHSMAYPAVDENMWADVKCECTNEECKNNTSSTIAAQCVVEISGWVYSKQSVAVAQTSVDDEVLVQTKETDVEWVETLVKTSGESTIRQDIRIEDSKPQVETLLDNSVKYIVKNVQVKQGSVVIDGYAQLDIIYSYEKGVSKAQSKLDNQIVIENPEIKEGEIVCLKTQIKYVDIKIYEDEDGRKKILSVEIPLFVSVHQEVPTRSKAVLDAYGIKSPLKLEYIDVELPQKTQIFTRSSQVSTVVNLDERFDEKNLYSLGDISVETVVADEQLITISGILSLRVWSEDGEHKTSELFYSTEIPMDKSMQDSNVECDATLKSLSIYKNNNNEWVCNSDVSVDIKSISRSNFTLVSEIQVGEEYKDDKYPLMLAITSSDDSLWTIARRCRVTIDDILELNPHLSTEPVVAGSPIIIYRK